MVTRKGGWTGQVLRINLSTGDIKVENTAKNAMELVGGTGLGAHYMLGTKSGIDPLGPENQIVIATGPAQGTKIPLCGRYVILSKSPLTGFFIDSHVGGFVGPELKKAGYDAIIITGGSEKPCYIEIFDDNVSIKDATGFWGKSTAETEKLLRDSKGGRVISIGIAGENQVKIACVVSDDFRNAGRGGIGAVFGSKKLKAIHVKGTGAVTVADPERVAQLAAGIRERTRKSRESGRGLLLKGTAAFVGYSNAKDQLPTRNFQKGEFEHWEDLTPSAIEKVATDTMKRPCYNCPLSCAHVYRDLPDWAEHGGIVPVPEYETLAMMGSNLGINDAGTIIKANYFANIYGLDTISTGNVIGFFMECGEKNLLPEEYRKEKVEFGDSEGSLELLKKIAERKGVGKLLGEGVKTASEDFGNMSSSFAIHVKGLEMAAWDPRGKKALGLSYATSSVGASHLRGWPVTAKIPDSKVEDDVIVSLADQQDFKKIKDSLIICHFTHSIEPPLNWKDCAEIYSALTGDEISVEGLKEKARKIWIACRNYNVKEKEFRVPREMEKLPWRIINEPLPSGSAEGCKAFVDSKDFNESLEKLYKLKNLDRWGYPHE
ncbi:MAG: aldehyde ferredoxin oxidoreductase family protein [Candidatus Hodarchaeales archaeon]